MSASSGGDVSHDGRRLAAFRILEGQTELIVASRDGSTSERVTVLPQGSVYFYPRWSPDDRSIAYQVLRHGLRQTRVLVDSTGGTPREVAKGDHLQGLTWLTDSSGIVYSSSQGSTVMYPPTLNLRVVRVDGSQDRQLTFGDSSYVDPDVLAGGVAASRVKSQSDIWKFPIDGTPGENVRVAARLTRQTGVAQVASVSPDEQEVVYLSDNGGHGNLWVAATDGSGSRQVTFEHDPSISIGVPVWSPVSNIIAFLMTRDGVAGQWLINADGSGLRELVRGGFWACWSPDGKWLYYVVGGDPFRIEKISADGGMPIKVRG